MVNWDKHRQADKFVWGQNTYPYDHDLFIYVCFCLSRFSRKRRAPTLGVTHGAAICDFSAACHLPRDHSTLERLMESEGRLSPTCARPTLSRPSLTTQDTAGWRVQAEQKQIIVSLQAFGCNFGQQPALVRICRIAISAIHWPMAEINSDGATAALAEGLEGIVLLEGPRRPSA